MGVLPSVTAPSSSSTFSSVASVTTLSALGWAEQDWCGLETTLATTGPGVISYVT